MWFLKLLLSVNCAVAAKNGREDFLWGVSTAAYQIEGAWNEDGRGPCIWDTFCAIPGKIYHNENGSIADDSYHKVHIDIELLKAMGLKAYRMSISWTRILPLGYGEVNQLGIDHYDYVINQLIEAGIEPLVTLYHWDLPQGLEDKYKGWLSSNIQKDFVNFANICFQHYGDRVKKWITINEPWTSAVNAYGKTGVFAPGRCSNRELCAAGNTSTESYIVAHNMLLAHAAVVQLYRQQYQVQQNGIIGITLNHDWAEPLTKKVEDIEAAQRHCEFSMAWFTDPINYGRYPAVMVEYAKERLPTFTEEESQLLTLSYDFIGLNHYTSKYYAFDVNRTVAGSGGWFDDQYIIETPYDVNGNIIGTQAASAWLQVVPWGFYNVIMWLHNRYATSIGPNSGPLIYVTENGVDVPRESDMTIEQALNDTFRINYYEQYLAQMDRAIQDGANIVGYFAWSLMDNFEWADGYSKRFGMHYVDYNSIDRPRYPKASAKWYSEYAKAHKDTYAGRYVDNDDNISDTDDVKPTEESDGWNWLDFLLKAIENSVNGFQGRNMPTIADL